MFIYLQKSYNFQTEEGLIKWAKSNGYENDQFIKDRLTDFKIWKEELSKSFSEKDKDIEETHIGKLTLIYILYGKTIINS